MGPEKAKQSHEVTRRSQEKGAKGAPMCAAVSIWGA